ncbi:MAG TPA: ABC transporter permease [Egibacteraceae bacterium]|nr:ABC transporter permease [Actinomycetota bacterium]HWB70837.1 ABC transporter permease [Egibacteraceae bacterium]
MSLLEAVKVAATAIAANRLRSALTVLGVVIGVMSVVLLVAVGTGARNEVTAGVEELGSNLLIVVPGSFEFGQAPTLSKFTLDDVERIGRELGGRAAVSGNLASGETVRAGATSAFASVLGVTADFDEVVNRPVARGEFLTESDIATGRRVAILGASAAEGLFADTDPIAKTVTIAGLRFRVIGKVERLGPTLGVDRDAQVLVPITAAQRLFGTRRVDTIFVKAPDADDLDEVAAEVEAILGRRLDAEEFSVLTQEEILGVAGRILSVLTLVLAAIAGISLLVGGIGVSNIMLVSVQERTREIGLRKALGARTRDVTLQFLVEAVVLCGLGGLLGIGLGFALAAAAEAFTPLPAAVTTWSVALAFGTSLAVGVAFGVFPARRAGRLDPVVALRYE